MYRIFGFTKEEENRSCDIKPYINIQAIWAPGNSKGLLPLLQMTPSCHQILQLDLSRYTQDRFFCPLTMA